MNVYRSVWFCLIGSVALLCVGVGMIIWPVWGVIAMFGVATLSAGAVIVAHQNQVGGKTATGADRWRSTAPPAIAAGLSLVAGFVLAETVGVATLAVLMLASATSPFVVKHVTRHGSSTRGDRPTRRPPDTGQQKPDAPVPPPVQGLSDRELCRMWRVTFADLQEASSTEARERIVSIRQACMDELERRNPGAMSAWFASGPRAASSPDRYLAQAGDEEHGDAA